MIDKNQTCGIGQDSMPYMTCLIHIFEEWFGVEQLEDYLNFANYLLWVFTPLILLILPYFTIFLLYLTIIFLHIYKRKNVLKEAYSHNLWDGARKTVATLWDGHAAVWHGYEVHGMEKIPEEGPALIIFYHGAIPIDFYYFMAKIFIHKGRTCRVVADHFVFKIPGFSLLLDVFCALHGPREKCVEILRSGHLLAISPGGVREALISDETYNIIWGNRKGFAQVAIDAKVPIIPMFTQNIREGFRSLGGTRLFRWLYEKFRYPFAPMYGGFPVKLRTYLGDPIPYDPEITAEELAEKTKNAVQALIDKHQRIPGNIMSALLERFHKNQKIN
ncbi:transmembrane protein 68 [Rhinolophus ferrumequinum]|uniref:Transmembrane protein 68 n=1 Tax=Rhinolophus ferrumequinum TaxID=59479 RepID=A0A671EH30_RHIFE|nr:transmembrane protein 68 isoform X2 [Rhinolophus ferrumequinum]KAF6323796.1 transmembrane protein 68 [Rhinolophus ferrumequinum]